MARTSGGSVSRNAASHLRTPLPICPCMSRERQKDSSLKCLTLSLCLQSPRLPEKSLRRSVSLPPSCSTPKLLWGPDQLEVHGATAAFSGTPPAQVVFIVNDISFQ